MLPCRPVSHDTPGGAAPISRTGTGCSRHGNRDFPPGRERNVHAEGYDGKPDQPRQPITPATLFQSSRETAQRKTVWRGAICSAGRGSAGCSFSGSRRVVCSAGGRAVYSAEGRQAACSAGADGLFVRRESAGCLFGRSRRDVCAARADRLFVRRESAGGLFSGIGGMFALRGSAGGLFSGIGGLFALRGRHGIHSVSSTPKCCVSIRPST